MMKKKLRFDQFICPLAEEEWYQKLEKLILEKRETASSKIKQLLKEEIKAEYLG